jgi:hypothetical protein
MYVPKMMISFQNNPFQASNLMGEVRHESGHSFIEPSLVIVAKIVFS